MPAPARRPPSRVLRWACDQIGPGSRVASIRPLQLGGWHVNHTLDVVDPLGRTHPLVLRRWARPGWDLEDPDFTVAREVTVLSLLAGAPVPTPEVVGADPDGDECDCPTLLVTRLPGDPPEDDPADMDAFLGQLAGALPPLHAVDERAGELVPSFRTYQDIEGRAPPSWLGRSRVWERAFEVATGPAPATATCLIHRDYHPGNTLWSNGVLTGVVDWTQGSWGPPGIDLGWMRWNLAVDHGLDAPARFLSAYEAVPGAITEYHPYWDVLTVADLVGAIDPHAPPPRDEGHARLEHHVARALALL